MRLEFPKTASVKDYLRTVDFESTEVKVHWTDERGEWVRETFASRPDNLVVQCLTAPQRTNGECPHHGDGGRRREGAVEEVVAADSAEVQVADKATHRQTSTSNA